MSDGSSRYLEHLPLLYRDDPLLGRFLLAFERVLSGGDPGLVGLEQLIERLDRLIRPRAADSEAQAPAEFLPWLASWVGFALRHDWCERQRRELLAQARWLHDRRGTAEGLERFLELGLAFTEDLHPSVTIQDRSSDAAGFFLVTVNPDTDTEDGVLHADHVACWIIDREKPAHTWYRLDVRAPRMQIVNTPTADRPGIRVGKTLLGSG